MEGDKPKPTSKDSIQGQKGSSTATDPNASQNDEQLLHAVDAVLESVKVSEI